MTLAVALAAPTKFKVASKMSNGINNGIQIRKYVLVHPAPDMRAASSISLPICTIALLLRFTPVVLPLMMTTNSSAQIVP